MKPPNNSANIPAHLRSITRSVFSFRDHTRGRTASIRLSRFSAPAISVALGVLLVSMALSASMFWRGGSVSAFTESIATYDLNSCANPNAIQKTTFVLGDKVWATVTGAAEPDPIFGIPQRRFQWIAPDFTLAQQADANTATDCDPYDLPTTGPFAQAGTWIVRTVDNSASGVAFTTFVVRDPNVAKADISVSMFGPGWGSAGASLTYTVDVTNRGPDTAQNITLTDPVPANTTFVSSTIPSCEDPSAGCDIGSLAAGDTASFTFVYNINAGTPTETLIVNTVQVSSSTAEPSEASQSNNSSTSVATVVNQAGASPCTISCPADIDANNSANQCSAIVTYATPTPSGSCTDSTTGQTVSVSCNPPSGSVFPIGATTVSCGIQTEGTSVTGNACSFTVTVHDTSPPVQPTITCPGDISVEEDSPDSGSASVNYASPTATGNCVTFFCDPPSGSGFRTGTTVVTCTATDSANNTVTCSFAVTVTGSGGGGCTITCPGDITQNASAGQCNAVVSYSSPTTSGNCGTVTCSPASGSTFSVGTTPVTCTSSQGPACDFTVTVNEPAAPTITTCASNKTVSANALCEGVMPNLLNEVVATGCSVTLSQSPAAGTILGPGVVTVTITAENSAGEATCTATVTVSETTPPVITSCAAGTSAPAGGSCQAPVPNVTGGVTASDNCTPSELLTITQSPAAGTLVGVGTTTITIIVKDASNNSATCTTAFTVNDAIPPTISCPADVSATAALGQLSTAVTFSPTVADNCSAVSVVCLPASGSAFPLGVTTVSCTATDGSGNQAGCTFKVAVSGTLLANGDSFLRNGADNTNEGGNNLLRIQSSGHNRVLARFDVSGIPTNGLQSAALVLNITDNSDNWGSSGRLVDAHRLLATWTEGNGHTVGDQPNFRGTGEGVTWNCAKDSNISNQNDDCTSQWDGGTFAAATAASVLHTNNQMGDVSWNVTADVLAGASNGWMIKKQTEGQNGQVKYFSKEGAAVAGSPTLGPRLVLVYVP